MQVGINAWLGAHLHICTSANANVSTGGDDAWVAAQADASAYMQCTWNLEYGRKEGAAHYYDRMLYKQMPSTACYMPLPPPATCSAPGIWNEEGRKHPRAWLGFRRKIN